MPVTQRKRSYQLFRKLKFSSSTTGDEGQLEIDKMILHVLDCLGALQCVMGQYDASRARIFWGAVSTIAEIGIDQAIGHVDKRHPGATHLLRAFPNEQKAADGRGWLPLHWAAVTDNVEVKDILTVARADPLATVKGCNQPISANPGHLIAAVRHPNMDVVRCLYNFYPRMANAKDNEGDLPLHYAARYSESTDMIQFLLQANAPATKIRGEGSLVPLHDALFNESTHRAQIVKCLLDADPGAAKMLNSDGDTSFHIALDQECGHEILDQLIKFFPEGLKISNDIGYLPLHVACFTKDFPRTKENVDLLLNAYMIAAGTPSASGFLPAHIAAEHSTHDVLESLLSAYPEAINHRCQDDNNNTPLLKAVMGSNEDTVEYICTNYPWAVDVTNVHNMNPLHVACEGDNLNVLSTLLVACPANIQKSDNEGRLPLHVFIQMHPDIKLENSCEADCLRFLLNAYSRAVDVEDTHNETPFTLCPAENFFMRRLLLMKNPDLSPEELRALNYANRRMGIFLAFSAINADGIPNIYSLLRGRDSNLLKIALSYL
jgi:ankyrin repeat protein